jgi:2-desacetyl-2-hydroxyethyl bacteriochlorophyllide A dehydrogenase
MSLAQQIYFPRPSEAAIRDIDVPLVEPGEVLLRATLSAISHGTEMNVYRGRAPHWNLTQDTERRLFIQGGHPTWTYPLAYGYACVGVVERVGEGVLPALVGTHAFCYRPHQSYHVLPATQLIPVGDLPDERAIFLANATTAFNGVLDATLHYGDVVVVFGQGVIGQIVGRLCKVSGCTVVVVDPLEDRLRQARGWGADVAINPGAVPDVALAVRDLTDNRGADTVFDVTGSPRALHEAIRTAAPDSEVVAMSWYGVPAADLVLTGEFHHNRIRIRSSQVGRINPLLVNWSPERRTAAVLDILRRFDVDRMITARFSPAQAAEAYAAVDHAEVPPLQAVFVYP